MIISDVYSQWVVENEEQREELQSTINRLVEWSTEWQMLFNSSKCHILHLGLRNAEYEYTMGGTALEVVEYEKDLGGHCAQEPEAQHAVCQGCSQGKWNPGPAI